jgi:hypothetical protein
MSLDLMSLPLFKSGMAFAFMDSAACRRRHGSAAAGFEIRFTPVGVFADSSGFRENATQQSWRRRQPQHYQLDRDDQRMPIN